MRVNREKFLQQLEAVQPGLSAREVTEQSTCFVFREGIIQTFNDEIACCVETDLEFEGAVQAAPLLAILRKMAEDEIDIEPGDGELLIRGKKRRAGIRMEAEITLPVESIETPKNWKELHADFCEAVDMVHQCTGSDQSKFSLTCVHVTPKWIEACDNHQMSRYRLKTGVTTPALFRGDSVKHIVSLGMTHFAESSNWLHFKNPIGLILSCKRFAREAIDFPDLTPILETKGAPTTLPKGLSEAVEKAQVFSDESIDRNHVSLELGKGRLRVKGEGASGWYSETKRLHYEGPPMSFSVSPKLLIDISHRHTECEISKKFLRVDGGRFVYVTCLETSKKKGKKVSEDDDSNDT